MGENLNHLDKAMKKRMIESVSLAERLRAVPVMIALAILGGCGEDPVATEISIAPASVTLTAFGETARFTANVVDQYGDPFDARVTWSSGEPEVFTVDSDGMVTAVANGSGTVSAVVGSIGAAAQVTVDAPVATAISISPDSVTLTEIGQTARFTARVTDQHGEDYSATVSWSSGATAIFTVDSDGVVTAVADGSGMVTAMAEDLSASAPVTVDTNRPPFVRPGVRQGLTVVMGAGGGARPWQPANRFDDPNDHVLDLTYTATLSDSSVATAGVVVDDTGIPWVVMAGTSPGMSELTVTATDPGGLSADVSIILAVDDSGLSPLSGLLIGNNRLQTPGLTLLGGCTPPFINAIHTTGALFTIHGFKWQTRSDSEAEWTDIEGTEVMTGQMCTHETRTPGEYRMAADVSTVLGAGLDPLRGAYSARNTFVVEDNPGGVNRAPEVGLTAPAGIALSAGGGPNLMIPAAHMTDPDFDDLEFSVAVSDTAVISAEIVTEGVQYSVVVATGLSAGIGTITVTATDPEGLSADMVLPVNVDDSGNTPYTTISVSNGVIRLLGFASTMCSPPFNGLVGVDGWVYTVHSSNWQTRSDSTAAWTDIDGTEMTDGRLCPYETDEPGDYRLVYEATIVVSQDVAPFRGEYASRDFFTVSSGN